MTNPSIMSDETILNQLLKRAEALNWPSKLIWPKKKLTTNHKVVGKASHRIKRMAVIVAQLKSQLKKLDQKIDNMPDCAFRDDLIERFKLVDRQHYLLKEHMRLEIRSEFWEQLKDKRYVGVGSGGQVFYLDIRGLEAVISSMDEMVDDIVGADF